MRNNDLRIGITMRVLQAEGYSEPRDALSQEWSGFLSAALPNAAWLPLPNLGAGHIRAYCEKWCINRLILSGGEDVGVSRIRDETEFDLLGWAKERAVPVLGICRGMQMMSMGAGIDLKPVTNHVRNPPCSTRRFDWRSEQLSPLRTCRLSATFQDNGQSGGWRNRGHASCRVALGGLDVAPGAGKTVSISRHRPAEKVI